MPVAATAREIALEEKKYAFSFIVVFAIIFTIGFTQSNTLSNLSLLQI